MTRHAIVLDAGSKAFYHGVRLGNETMTTLAATPGWDALPHEQRLSLYHLYVGVNADRDLVTAETMDKFIAGTNTRAPQRRDAFVLELRTAGDAFGTDEDDCAREIAATLLRLIRSGMLESRDSGPLIDANGATCGRFEFFDE